MDNLIILEGIILHSGATYNSLLSLSRGNVVLADMFRKIIDEKLGACVRIDLDNPTEEELKSLYNTMFEVGGFDDVISNFSDFVKTTKLS
jgi:hypothetical protein